ncbi:MAG: alpha/beta fold hydrolase [Burkholderiaceae bacterium]
MKSLPALIALPGTLMDEAALRPLLDALDLPVTVELLGVEDDFDAEIERLAALVSRPTLWIGHSLGGIAALHLAARRPARCASLVVVASNLRPDGPCGPHSRAQQLAELERGGMSGLLRQQLAPIYGLDRDDGLLAALQAQAERIGPERFRRQLGYAASRPGLLHGPSTLRMPVLALSGAEDPLCPTECGEEVIARSPRGESRHHVLPGAGHLLPLQAPAWCAQHIRAFLEQTA